MPTAPPARRRTRGEIEALPSGSLRVRVYAGVDPVTKKRHFLIETVPAGPRAAKEGGCRWRKGYAEVLPAQAIATLRGIALENAEAELQEAGVVPTERRVTWADPTELPVDTHLN